MHAVRHLPIAWLVALGATGCLVGDPSYEVPKPGSLQSVSSNSLSLNGLYFYQSTLSFSTYQRLGKESLNGLAPGAITYNSPGADGLEHTAEGRQVLKYVATCALPEDMVLVAETDGQQYEFPGHLGLAPEWVGEACDETCQRWVSACLLAHINAKGEKVPISIRGRHPQLQADAAEQATYGFEEAAFYGNLFEEPVIDEFGEEQLVAYACTGRSLNENPTGSSYLIDRLCGHNGSSCGFTETGLCWDFFENPFFPAPTCLVDSSGQGYSDCANGRMSAVNPPDHDFSEVVTVHLLSDSPGDAATDGL